MPFFAHCVVSRGRPSSLAQLLAGLLLGLALGWPGGAARAATPEMCNGGKQLPVQDLMPGGAPQPDLLVNGPCNVDLAQNGANPTTFYYGNVIIASGGKLDFEQPKTGNPDINFWASSIIVEANGSLTAGANGLGYGDPTARGDQRGGFLTIYLYGKNQSVDAGGNPVDPITKQGLGALCPAVAGFGPCGIPTAVWSSNGSTALPGCGAAPITAASKCIPGLPTAAKDYFYDYAPLYGDGLCTDGSTYSAAGGKATCGSDPADGKVGYFGYKVLAVSYGGALVMRGYKGSETCEPVSAPGLLCPVLTRLQPGNSWMRLNVDLNAKAASLTVDGTPGNRWLLASDAAGGHPDQVVVTTTDYVPDHSEVLTLSAVQASKVTFTPANQWFHKGTRYPLALGTAKTRLLAAGMDPNLVSKGAEVRAAVALLTRNIRIVSAGDKASETFAQAAARTLCPDKVTKGCYYFGGHTIFRQGILQVQVQGVEFAQLGQGGKIGHYPIHFHKTRQVPPNTYVNDSSVNDSNTRWYVLHSTQGVTFQRDVGWKSIGHGYYFEDGTEADNNLYSDIGIFARAAIPNPDNPRMVPGILADNQGNSDFDLHPTPPKQADVVNPGFPYRSDNEYPTVFWITNGWNNFQGDMAAGAGACGASYWFVPSQNSDTPDVPTLANTDDKTLKGAMKWDDGSGVFGYAGLQRGFTGALPRNGTFAGSTAVESFFSNYATSTMMSIQTTPDAPGCAGFVAANEKDPATLGTPFVREIASFAPKPTRKVLDPGNKNSGTGPDLINDPYYPHAIGAKKTTRCPLAATQIAGMPTRYNCSQPPIGTIAGPCADGSTFPPGDPNSPENPCAPTVIDHFTSSFHWTQGNVSAVWLRPFWYLVTNSVITDVQQGGLTFVTGGDVTRSSIISGYWGLSRDSILVGHTQPQDSIHRFALDIGPFNSFTNAPPDNLKCAALLSPTVIPSYCLNAQLGVSLPVADFFSNQRLENIYDGPSYRDSNAYLDVKTAECSPDGYNGAGGCIYGAKTASGILKNPGGMPSCYLPNAAIAWKQPNGFYYPPAFHASNLYFGNVDIRHFVIDPLFKAYSGSTSPFVDPKSSDFGQAGTYITDPDAVNAVYCLPAQVDPKIYFNSWTGIDRQTELNDDDGSLTGLSNDIQKTLMPPNVLKQTISVNEDDYFTAPVETPECASNIGKNNDPATACSPPVRAAPTVTAKTSPYDYVSTVIYHTPVGGYWDANCADPQCYGVPLYRQFLAGVKGADAASSTREWKHWYNNGCNTDPTKVGITTACRWPFMRMSGTALGTRETLTINNGTYYLDTTVPKTIQQTEPYNTTNGGSSLGIFVNIFAPDFVIPGTMPPVTFVGTYDVFFVYPKTSTRQTYLIYLGPNATAADIKAIQVRLDNLQLQPDFPTTQPWLTTDTSQIATKGIIGVTVDFTKLTDGTLDTTPANGLCQPHTFCKASGDSCVSALSPTDPMVIANPNIVQQANAVCGQWAVKDLDCPPKGCYGFSFTIPKTGFTAGASLTDPSPNRPAPMSFPSDAANQGKPTWLVKFLQTTVVPDNTGGSQCNYTTLPTYPPPGVNECTVPDWVPQ